MQTITFLNALSVVLVCLAAPAAAQYSEDSDYGDLSMHSAAALKLSCEMESTNNRSTAKSMRAYALGRCVGFIEAAIMMAAMLDKGPTQCIPGKVTVGQMIKIVRAWLQTRTVDSLNGEQSLSAIAQALKERFPCDARPVARE